MYFTTDFVLDPFPQISLKLLNRASLTLLGAFITPGNKPIWSRSKLSSAALRQLAADSR